MKNIDLNNYTLFDALKRAAEVSQKSSRGIYFIDGNGNEKFQSYSDLYINAQLVLRQLNQNDIHKGDKLIFQIKNEYQFVNTFWACIIGGIVPVPIKCASSNKTTLDSFSKLIGISKQIEHLYIITETEIKESLIPFQQEFGNAKILVFEEILSVKNDIQTTFSYPNNHDLALIQYSSGSTGDPKGVQLTNYNLVHNVNDIINSLEMTENDFVANWMPLTHDMGLIGLHMMPLFRTMNQLIISSDTFVRKPFMFLQKITKHKATIFGAPNFAISWMHDKISDSQLKELNLEFVRIIFNGAEPISVNIAKDYLKRFAQCGLKSNTMYTVYGMAEACVAVCIPRLNEFNTVVIEREPFTNNGIVRELQGNSSADFIELADEGYPLSTMKIGIVDENGSFLTENCIGEIVIKGPNVTKGYYNNPAANESLFIDGFLKTGDLGFIRNSRLVVTGRKKDIIFVNGQNYYPHDLEAVAAEVEDIEQRNIVFTGYNDPREGIERILGFLVFRKNIEEFVCLSEKIKIYLFQRLGIQIHLIIPVNSIPKTTSGKVQRYKFRKDFEDGLFADIITQIKTLEEKLSNTNQADNGVCVEILAEHIFRLEPGQRKQALINYFSQKLRKILPDHESKISIYKNLILYGLDSIKTVELVSIVENELGIKISPVDIIELATIEEIAIHCEKAIADKNVQAVLSTKKIIPESDKKFTSFPLTDIQFAYWLGRGKNFELGNNGCHVYQEINCSNLDIEKFEIVWNMLIKRHDMLRVSITNDGQQIISDKVPSYNITLNNLISIPDQQEQLIQIRTDLSHKVYDATQWPLFHIEISKINKTLSRIHFSMDMLIADLWSFQVLFNELYQFYSSSNATHHPLELSFRDYSIYEKEQKQTELYDASKQYWLNQLHNLPPAPELPLLKKPSELEKPVFNRRQIQLPIEKWQLFKDNARVYGLTASNALLSVFAEVLAKWSKNQDFTLNLTYFNRPNVHEQIKDIIGDFTSVIPLNFNFSTSHDFITRAKQVQKRLFSHIEHRHFNGVEIIRELAREENKELQAVLPVIFTSAIGNGNVGIDDYLSKFGEIGYGISQTPQVILDHQVYENSDALVLRWDTVDSLFPDEVLDTMFNSYIDLINELSEDASIWQKTSLTDIPSSQKAVRAKVNHTEAPITIGLLHSKFIHQAIETPQNIAVIADDKILTYNELINYAWSLSIELKAKNVSTNELVAILMEKGWEQVVAALGILMSGAAYLPVSSDLPEDRISHLLHDSNTRIVIKQKNIQVNLDKNHEVIELDKLVITPFDLNNYLDVQNCSDLAYIIYTSGSTGLPKGVMIDHKGALNTVLDINKQHNVQPIDRIFGISALNFDLSVYDIFGALNAGAAIVIPESSKMKDPSYWLQLIENSKVSIWNSVPALMEMLVTYIMDNNKEIPESLRLVLMSGDWIPVNLPKKIKQLNSQIEIISMGGATEASIWSIYYPIKEVKPEWKSIPYGIPLRNQRFHILNNKLEDCPDYVAGHLYIAGVGLALGYKNDEEKTRKAFLHHPTTKERIYKTGDLGRYHPDGTIEFLGREDSQVKINGYRIELGEIEKKLMDNQHVRESVVLVNESSSKNKQLVAFFVPNYEHEFHPNELKEHMSKVLPDYMIPAHYIKVPLIPLTRNGKVDRQKLLSLVEQNLVSTKEYIAPKNKTEQDLVKIFSEIMCVEKIGVTSNFFDIGASSLEIVRAQSKIKEVFNRDIPVVELFRYINIKSLASFLDETNGENVSAQAGQERSERRKQLGKNRLDRRIKQ